MLVLLHPYTKYIWMDAIGHLGAKKKKKKEKEPDRRWQRRREEAFFWVEKGGLRRTAEKWRWRRREESEMLSKDNWITAEQEASLCTHTGMYGRTDGSGGPTNETKETGPRTRYMMAHTYTGMAKEDGNDQRNIMWLEEKELLRLERSMLWKIKAPRRSHYVFIYIRPRFSVNYIFLFFCFSNRLGIIQAFSKSKVNDPFLSPINC